MAKKKRAIPIADLPKAIPDPNVMPDITGPGGVKSKYRPEFDKLLVEHMAKGLSFDSFAAITEVALSTMYVWLKTHASFQEAYDLACNKYLMFWETMGVYYLIEGRAVKGPDGKEITKSTEKINAGLYKFNMINRFEKWRNAGSEETGGHVTVNLHGQIMDAIDAKRKKKD